MRGGGEDARAPLGNALGYHAHGADVRVVQRFHAGVEGAPEGGEVDHHVGLGVLERGRGQGPVDGQQDLALAEKHLVHPVAARVHYGRHRRDFAPAGVVEVQHALDGVGLVAVNDGCSIFGEKFRFHYFLPPRAMVTTEVMWVSGP